MSEELIKRIEKRVRDLTLEKSLLTLRIFDLQTNLRLTGKITRKQEKDIELIKKSGVRLIEIENALSYNRNLLVQYTPPIPDSMFGLQRTPNNDKKDNKNEQSSQSEIPIKKPRTDQSDKSSKPKKRSSEEEQLISTIQENPPIGNVIVSRTASISTSANIAPILTQPRQATSVTSSAPTSAPVSLQSEQASNYKLDIPLKMGPDTNLTYSFEGPPIRSLNLPQNKYIPTDQERQMNKEKIENLRRYIDHENAGTKPKAYPESSINEYINEPHPSKMRLVPRTVPRTSHIQTFSHTKNPEFIQKGDQITTFPECPSLEENNQYEDFLNSQKLNIESKPPIKYNTISMHKINNQRDQSMDLNDFHQIQSAQIRPQTRQYVPEQTQTLSEQNCPNYLENINNHVRDENIYTRNYDRTFDRIPYHIQHEQYAHNPITQAQNRAPNTLVGDTIVDLNRLDRHRNEPRHHRERARETFLRRLRMIPRFDGDSFKDMKDFVDIVNTLYNSCLNELEET